MPDQPPLNPDAFDAAWEALYEAFSGRIGDLNGNDCERMAETAIQAYLAAALPEVTSVEEADNLPIGSVVILRNGTARLRTDWSSGWASAKAGDDYPTDDKGCFPARVLHIPEVNDA